MSKNVIGLMSGTSVDGIDAALVKVADKENKINVELIDFISIPYAKEFKNKIFNTLK